MIERPFSLMELGDSSAVTEGETKCHDLWDGVEREESPGWVSAEIETGCDSNVQGNWPSIGTGNSASVGFNS